MSEFHVTLAALQRRITQLEANDQALGTELAQLRQQFDALNIEHNDLIEDHGLLSKDFIAISEKHRSWIDKLCDQIQELAVLAGGTAAHVFPNLGPALDEIEQKLGLEMDSEPRSLPKKPSG